MRWHWQNLNEDRRGDVKGSGFWHGRAWFDFGKTLAIRTEWVLWTKRFALQVGLGGEDSLGFHFAIPPVQLFLSFSLPFRWLPSRHMTSGIRIFDRAIWLELWNEEWGGWTNYGSYWRNAWGNRQLVIHLDDLLLGRQTFSKDTLETKRGLVCMPEGTYEIDVTFERLRWKRPRWFGVMRLGADIKCLKPIPVPGKGENSWDCGEDAIYGMSCGATNMAEAIAEITKSIFRSRERYGGLRWKPE